MAGAGVRIHRRRAEITLPVLFRGLVPPAIAGIGVPLTCTCLPTENACIPSETEPEKLGSWQELFQRRPGFLREYLFPGDPATTVRGESKMGGIMHGFVGYNNRYPRYERAYINCSSGVCIHMAKQSINLMIIFMAVFVILSAGMAGCTSPAQSPQAPTASPVPAKTLSTIAPSEMVLQPSDFPGNFTLLEKGERNVSMMRNWSLEHGWKGGYYADYEKNNLNSPSGTIFAQSISVYPAQNITLIVPDTVNLGKIWSAKDPYDRSVEEVSLPTIGDFSSVLKISDKSENSLEYMIAFVKYDVYEEFYTNGTATDYETLVQLAGIAAAKIK